MTDYTQHGEQKYFLEVLGYDASVRHEENCPCAFCGNPGRLLEIGAWEPKTFSNSRALIELGWEAVLFEPSPGPLKKLLEEYRDNPRVTVVGLPVTTSTSGFPVRLKVTDDALSSDECNAEHFKTWSGYPFYGTLTTIPMNMGFALSYFGPFDFISIDTEGGSVDLFVDLCLCNFITYLPRCVVVEHNERWAEMKAACEKAGYHPLHHPDGSIMNFGGCNVILERGK